MAKSYSVLRFPGGKSKASKILKNFVPPDCKELCSPFFGGGSFELFLTKERNAKIYGYDLFKPVVEFWQCLQEDKVKLYEHVKPFHPLSKEDFYNLQKRQEFFLDKFDRAAVFYVLNRASFSGSTLSGGMSSSHPRFNHASIERIKNFDITNFTVECKDFGESIEKHKNIFQYLDPPYLIKSNLYGKKGSAHKNFDHDRLRQTLSIADFWFMSYNDCEEIRKMYDGFKILSVSWKYGMSKNKNSSEILIFSKKYEDFFKNPF